MVFECEASRADDKKHRKHRSHKEKEAARDADCRDLKERKDCVKARAVCNWCESSFAPAMCLDEVRTLSGWGRGRDGLVGRA